MKLPAVGLGTDLSYLNTMSALTSGTNYSKTAGNPADSGTSYKPRFNERNLYGPQESSGGRLDLSNIGADTIESANRQLAQNFPDDMEVIKAGKRHRTSEYIQAIQDGDIDPETKRELASIYNSQGISGYDNSPIAIKIAEARAGKGLYAVRKVNFKEAAFMQDMPGRSQIVSLGKGKVLGS